MAIASNLLREPLRCRELLPLQPSPTCARHLGLLVLLTGANQHRVIPPASYGGVYDIYPRTQSAVTLYIGGVLGGRAVNLPILFGHLPSDHWPRYQGVFKIYTWGGVSGEPQRTIPYPTYGLLICYPIRIYRLMIIIIRLGVFPLLRDTFGKNSIQGVIKIPF